MTESRYQLIEDIVKKGGIFYLYDENSRRETSPFICGSYGKINLVARDGCTTYDNLSELLSDLKENHPDLYTLTL